LLRSPSACSVLRRPLVPVAALVLALAALVVAGCGGGGSGSENADPAKVAPKNSLIYFSAFVRPEGDQKEAVDAIAKKVLDVDDPGERIQGLLNQAIKEEDSKLTYDDDIKPWLGRQAAVAVTSLDTSGDNSQVAVIIAAKDTDKAKDALDKLSDETTPKPAKRSYEDVDYRYDASERSAAGVVDDYVVIGTEAGFKAVVDASKGEGLTDNKQFDEASKDADDKLAFGYVDTKALVSALGAQGQLPGGGQSLQSLIGAANQPITMSVDAAPERVTVEAVAAATRGAQARASQLLPELPGDSWLGLGVTGLGKAINQTLEQLGGGIGAGLIETAEQQLRAATGLSLRRDLLPSLGELAVFVRGAGILTVGGGVVIKPDDSAAAKRVLDKIGPFIRRAGASDGLRVTNTTVAGARGLKITIPNVPGSINAVLRDDRLVIAYTDAATEDALEPDEKLGDNPQFQQAGAALGGAVPALYVAFAPIAELASAASPENAAQIKQYLDAFTTLAAGTRIDGDKQIGRFVINLK
jgi:Protein of unknown function (DUF3352)